MEIDINMSVTAFLISKTKNWKSAFLYPTKMFNSLINRFNCSSNRQCLKKVYVWKWAYSLNNSEEGGKLDESRLRQSQLDFRAVATGWHLSTSCNLLTSVEQLQLVDICRAVATCWHLSSSCNLLTSVDQLQLVDICRPVTILQLWFVR